MGLNRKTCSQMKAFKMSVFFLLLFPVERENEDIPKLHHCSSSFQNYAFCASCLGRRSIAIHRFCSHAYIYIDALIRTINDRIEIRILNGKCIDLDIFKLIALSFGFIGFDTEYWVVVKRRIKNQMNLK